MSSRNRPRPGHLALSPSLEKEKKLHADDGSLNNFIFFFGLFRAYPVFYDETVIFLFNPSGRCCLKMKSANVSSLLSSLSRSDVTFIPDAVCPHWQRLRPSRRPRHSRGAGTQCALLGIVGLPGCFTHSGGLSSWRWFLTVPEARVSGDEAPAPWDSGTFSSWLADDDFSCPHVEEGARTLSAK